MKCQKCPKAATLHITEILSEEQIEELHLCEECAHKYLYEPQRRPAGQGRRRPPGRRSRGAGRAQPRVRRVRHQVRRFPQPGRLGCPHDYQEFREELMPLLENIHGETQPLRQGAAPPAAEQADPDRS